MKAKYEDVKKFQEELRKITGRTPEQTKEREAFFFKPRISIVTQLHKPRKRNQKD